MDKIIVTNRLYLREFIKKDGFHFFCINSDPEVIKYTGDKAFNSIDEAMKFIDNYSEYERFGIGRWAVCSKNDDSFLGWCGLKYEPIDKTVDLGFRFYRKHWNKGYATEAGIACLKYGFEKFRIEKIIGKAYVENHASVSVLQKCGMKFVKKIIYDKRTALLYEINNEQN